MEKKLGIQNKCIRNYWFRIPSKLFIFKEEFEEYSHTFTIQIIQI